MKDNEFIYADLSTYDLITAKNFYTTVFGWSYFNSGEDYWVAYAGNQEASGLYETPQKFKDMNMPSFWMSYIQVDDVEFTAGQARELGGIIELMDLDASIGKIALIRDPSGAGFTIYEGDRLNARTDNVFNTMVWNELFVSAIDQVQYFYETIFDWKIVSVDENKSDILDSNGAVISSINQVDNSLKGKYEYWAVFFRVRNLKETKRTIVNHGGSIVYEDNETTLAADPFGAFFHLVE